MVRMGKTLLGCGFVLLSLAAGCGGSSGDDDEGGSGGAVPISSFASRTAATACKLTYECCTSAQRAENAFFGTTEAECTSNYSALFTLVVPEINQSISQGRLRYDGNAYGACLAQIEAAGCAGTVTDPLQCDNALVPLVESGGACTQQGECIDSACIGGDSSADVDGQCGAPLANGADCTDDGECSSGYCDGLSCAAQVANGAACSTDAQCQSDQCNTTTFVCEEATSAVCE
jgi:hypothetical protein